MKGRARIMLAMARDASGDEVHAALPEDKRAVAELESQGLVTVRRTTERCGGYIEWWYQLANV
ncbi:hypothetical protein AKJ09_00052 [Labilithrix luteola]|uniref:Uncharacterized protein n=1 Tax=Labilithrix luteola TaxID=1391654 RepID=A0A0K1PIL1_9BACT|nr:hypothetical protein AKJ09_00052 [Labilithrix luteola]